MEANQSKAVTWIGVVVAIAAVVASPEFVGVVGAKVAAIAGLIGAVVAAVGKALGAADD